MIAFGPVPSRRLGQSLGVNHIPAKICTYSCLYCQVGPTSEMRVGRQEFHTPSEVAEAVMRRVRDCAASGVSIDYITFVPDGEPTLDANLGEHIRELAGTGIPVAVITNATLLWMPEVRRDLAAADLVSVKIDTTSNETWRRLNRPHGKLDLERLLDGIRTFAREYGGKLISETMLVKSVNDTAENIADTTDFLAAVAPARAYIGVPTRPPTDPDIAPPGNRTLVHAYETMRGKLDHVELLVTHETGTFPQAHGGLENLLGILAVHPMREADVLSYLHGGGMDTSQLETLIRDGRVERVEYRGNVFYVRNPFGRARRARRHPRSAWRSSSVSPFSINNAFDSSSARTTLARPRLSRRWTVPRDSPMRNPASSWLAPSTSHSRIVSSSPSSRRIVASSLIGILRGL